MTRRALSPSVSADAERAPVISKATELPCSAFGSMTVLILLLPFPRSWGARGDVGELSKKVRRELRAVLNLSSETAAGCWPGGRENPRPAAASPASPAARSRSLPKRRAVYILGRGLSISITQHVGHVLSYTPIQRAR